MPQSQSEAQEGHSSVQVGDLVRIFPTHSTSNSIHFFTLEIISKNRFLSDRYLTELDVSHNWLESVDSVITVLRQLEIINMSHNNLSQDTLHYKCLAILSIQNTKTFQTSKSFLDPTNCLWNVAIIRSVSPSPPSPD